MKLHNLTDGQLWILHVKVWERINRVYAGGLSFGIDWPTLRGSTPNIAGTLRRLMDERKRRGLKALDDAARAV